MTPPAFLKYSLAIESESLKLKEKLVFSTTFIGLVSPEDFYLLGFSICPVLWLYLGAHGEGPFPLLSVAHR